MQQVKNSGDQRSSQAQWLQLGLLSASILAPLMQRWNELRAMERTRALREDIEDRLQILRASSPWSRRTTQKQVEDVIQDIGATLPARRSVPKLQHHLLGDWSWSWGHSGWTRHLCTGKAADSKLPRRAFSAATFSQTRPRRYTRFHHVNRRTVCRIWRKVRGLR